MSKTIVLEPFSEWDISTDLGIEDTQHSLTRRSDRHVMKIAFRQALLYVVLSRPGNCDHDLQCYEKEDLAKAVQFVDKYIDLHYLPAAEAARLLREADFREKSLQQQIDQLQISTSATGQA